MQPVSPEATRVGWIGTGVTGEPMCGHLLARGYRVTVSTRTRARAESLVTAGARWADTPADVGARSDLVFTMVGLPAEVREVVLGARGVLRGARTAAVLVDMSTSGPAGAPTAPRHSCTLWRRRPVSSGPP